jgi:hypothetical protein
MPYFVEQRGDHNMFLADLMKSWIAIGCEGIWLYYGFILLAKLQWSITSSPNLFIWILTSILGYGMSAIFRGKDVKSGYVYSIYVSAAVVVLTLQNYFIVEPSLKYRIAAGLALLFLYFRAIYFAVQHPQRRHMLLRLEGNMLFYLFYVLVQIGNPFTTGTIHVTFAISLVISLMGMVITLGDAENEDAVPSQKVGDVRWLLFPSFVFIVGGLLISILLLLPSIHLFISSALEGLGSTVISFGGRFLSAVKWLLSLIPPPGSKGKWNLPAPPVNHLPQEIVPDSGEEFPAILLIGLLGLLVLSVFYYLIRFIRKGRQGQNEKRPIYSSTTPFSFVQLKSWFHNLLNRIASLLRRIGPEAYSLRIYWNYYQFLNWGKKQGLAREKNETPKEFAVRVNERLKGDVRLQCQISEFSDLFAAVYYSGETVHENKQFDTLIQELRQHSIQKP